MTPVYEWVDHTAELELHVEAETEDEVFAEAMAALGELMVEHMDDRAGGQSARYDVHASAPDRATLLAEWLSELVYLAEAERFVPERVESFQLSDDTVDATVGGVRATPPNLVKAVTYHRLEFAPHDGSWRATVVLDV
jgi:SHS2 domain-containing protein